MLSAASRLSRVDLVGVGIFAVVSVVALSTSSAADWAPVGLILLLGFSIVASELLSIGLPSGLWRVSSSAPYALALVLLEPVPALTIAVSALILDAGLNRKPASHVIENLANYGTRVVSGTLLGHAATERWGIAPGEPEFLLLVLVAFLCRDRKFLFLQDPGPAQQRITSERSQGCTLVPVGG
ncbi:MAG: hypothetical protein M3N43_06690 [Actinomycetota bacterium]|nr:hypothetical protein [Actinomycetota bacterium]